MDFQFFLVPNQQGHMMPQMPMNAPPHHLQQNGPSHMGSAPNHLQHHPPIGPHGKFEEEKTKSFQNN